MTNPPKCRGTMQHCNESSSPSWWKPAAPTSRSKPLTTTKGLAKGRDHIGHRCRARTQREEQLRLPTATKAPSPMTANHTRSNNPRTKDNPLCVIVAELHPRRSSSDFTSPDLAPPDRSAKRWRATIEDNNQGHNDFQMRRLQEGHDSEDAVVARPRRIGFSPLEEDARGRGSSSPSTPVR